MDVDSLIKSLEKHKEEFGNNRVIILDESSERESQNIDIYHFKNTFLLLAAKSDSEAKCKVN